MTPRPEKQNRIYRNRDEAAPKLLPDPLGLHTQLIPLNVVLLID